MKSSAVSLEFPFNGGREIVCSFDGGDITSDAGLVLLSQADKKCSLLEVLAKQIKDRRDPNRITHSIPDMLRERVYAIAQGYEDANDLDTLRDDSALKVACGKLPSASDALASQPTISRLENMVDKKELLGMGLEMARVVVRQLPSDTKQVTLDIDATNDPCYGQQELCLFDGHYGNYCYLPLYVHITDETGRQQLLGTLLRSACGRSTKGVMSLVRLCVSVVRERFPKARIVLRGDCGFGYGRLMNWCDANGIDYVFAYQCNKVTARIFLALQMDVAVNHRIYGDGHREYQEHIYKGKTWSRERRLIAKVEANKGVIDTRLVVTSDTVKSMEGVYKWYTERGDRENRIKEMKLDLSSGRTSCHRFLANQFRLLLHTAACVLMGILQHALLGTKWERSQVGTLRLRLLKVGARVVQSCRKVWFHLPTAFPDIECWIHLQKALSCS